MSREKAATLRTTEVAVLEEENARLRSRLSAIAAVAGTVAKENLASPRGWMATMSSIEALASDALEAA